MNKINILLPIIFLILFVFILYYCKSTSAATDTYNFILSKPYYGQDPDFFVPIAVAVLNSIGYKPFSVTHEHESTFFIQTETAIMESFGDYFHDLRPGISFYVKGLKQENSNCLVEIYYNLKWFTLSNHVVEEKNIFAPSLVKKIQTIAVLILKKIDEKIISGSSGASIPKHYNISNDEINDFLSYSIQQILPLPLRSHPVERRFALIIGLNNDNYKPSKNLLYSVAESIKLKKILEKNGYAVKVLLNEQATRKSILDWLGFFCSISRTPDSFFFYYVGHGLTLESSLGSLSSHVIDYYLKKGKIFSENEKYKDCYFLCYQDKVEIKNNNQLITSLVGNHEVLSFLKESNFTIHIEMLNSCSARNTVIKFPSSFEIYYSNLKSRLFFFFCMNKDIVWEREFSPVIYSGLDGGADQFGNNDSVVSVFELINYTNNRLESITKPSGMNTANIIKSVIYGNGDTPLTIK